MARPSNRRSPRRESSKRLIDPDSLSESLDAINDALFHARVLTDEEKTTAGEWIAGRQGLFGSYHGMCAPTEADIKMGIRVFTGEPVRTIASLCHVLGEEACRVLALIGSGNEKCEAAYRLASAEVDRGLSSNDGKAPRLIGTDLGRTPVARTGVYCCKMCSCALWRNLSAGAMRGGISAAEERLLSGLTVLRQQRDGKGRWGSFPFWYVLLVLADLDIPEAREEIQYASPAVEKSYRRLRRNDKYPQRRRLLAERVLGGV